MNADYDYLMKIIVAGESGSGKSSLLQQYVDKFYMESFISTIGVDFRFKTITLESGKTAKLQLWDTAGQERFKSIVASYWRNADAVVFVYDVTDLTSFQRVQRWADDVNRSGKPTVQKLLVANKVDLASHRVVTREMGLSLAQALSSESSVVRYFETSAKTALNVSEAFADLAETTACNYQQIHGLTEGDKKKLQEEQRKKRLNLDDDQGSLTCCSVM